MGRRRLLNAALDALIGLAELPPEPGTPERTEALLDRRRGTDLERQVTDRFREPETVKDRIRPRGSDHKPGGTRYTTLGCLFDDVVPR